MTTEQYINRLCRNIKAERFAWDKYLTLQNYFGKELCVTPLHASYGQIGYTIHFPYSREPMPELILWGESAAFLNWKKEQIRI